MHSKQSKMSTGHVTVCLEVKNDCVSIDMYYALWAYNHKFIIPMDNQFKRAEARIRRQRCPDCEQKMFVDHGFDKYTMMSCGMDYTHEYPEAKHMCGWSAKIYT
jgi:hypothetical protein